MSRLAFAIVLAMLHGISAAAAQVYPFRAITMIVPFAAGGPSDVVARILSERLRASLGQSIVIENVAGGGGSIGMGRVARSAPDGYTVGVGSWSTNIVNGAIHNLQYDVVTDFEPVVLLPANPLFIAANGAVPAKDLKELVAWLKANEDKVSVATSGAGTSPHVAGVMLQKITDTRLQMVHYRGGAPAIQDLLSGQVHLFMNQASSFLPHVGDSKLKVYAVLSKERLPQAPDVPTVDEAGLPGFYLSSWNGQAPDVNYPNRAIKIICSAPAGGGTDLAARIVADHLQKLWGQPVTVENRTGGSNNIGGEAVARSEPDGYTLLATPPNAITVNAVLFRNLNYDPTALEPVVVLAMAPNMLVVKNDLPVKNVTEWVAYAKANATKMSYASQGNGSTTHLTMELLKSRTGTRVTHVPYRGAAPAVNDLAGGHVDTMFSDLGGILPLHQDGKVRIIAAAGLRRVAQLPDIPTIDESGVNEFNSSTFYSLMAPPKTPAVIRDKLNKAIIAGMQMPEVQAKLKSIYVNTSNLDIRQIGDFIKAEAKLWQDVIRAAKITVEQ